MLPCYKVMNTFLIYGEEPHRIKTLIDQTLKEFSFDEEETVVSDKFDGEAVAFLNSFSWLADVKCYIYKPRELKEADNGALLEYLKKPSENVLIIAPEKVDKRQKKFLDTIKDASQFIEAKKYSQKQVEAFIRKMLPDLDTILVDRIINVSNYYEEGEVFYTFQNHLVKLKALSESGYEITAKTIDLEFGEPAQKIFSASKMLMDGDIPGFVAELEKTPSNDVLSTLGALFYEVKRALNIKNYGYKESGTYQSALEKIEISSLESLLEGVTDGMADIKSGRKNPETVLEQVTGLFVRTAANLTV